MGHGLVHDYYDGGGWWPKCNWRGMGSVSGAPFDSLATSGSQLLRWRQCRDQNDFSGLAGGKLRPLGSWKCW